MKKLLSCTLSMKCCREDNWVCRGPGSSLCRCRPTDTCWTLGPKKRHNWCNMKCKLNMSSNWPNRPGRFLESEYILEHRTGKQSRLLVLCNLDSWDGKRGSLILPGRPHTKNKSFYKSTGYLWRRDCYYCKSLDNFGRQWNYNRLHCRSSGLK